MASRTVLELAQEAAERAGAAPPSALYGSNDRIARRLRTGIKDVMRDLMRRSPRKGHSELVSKWTFTLNPGQFAYPLPPDYRAMVPDTEQRDRWPMGLIGPASAVTWARWLSGVIVPATPYGWRIYNGELYMQPTPEHSELVVIEYLTRFMVVKNAKNTQDALVWSDDLNFAAAPFVPRDGEISISEDYFTANYPGGAWGEAVWGTSTWGGATDEVYEDEIRQLPDQSGVRFDIRAVHPTADTDRLAITDDHVISLGLTYRLRKGLGLSYTDEMNEYTEERSVVFADDHGGARDIPLGGSGEHYDVAFIGDGGKVVIS
ncbi:MAG: hypothetical protein AAGE80_05380 [Pseudomonadota bacterium]